ncbi:flagellar hook protein FlgE [Maridesulfovibrio ferrireducens]|uniref:Flagellar hook protein FlgE n=1 Tax=Maridesulfovibrio ferrireducens TaxID=246191 RepID=A0A1G9JI60_9BACT|nr:flagellar hook protein FlgE [Maridesulfovibrio ferrireducens]SDL37287.1 flagellar hook protein FlgE [Maridesulfovibrio ferrireducens]
MGITSSLYTGISGLNVNSQATSVVSNNLANSSTVGFKGSYATFEDVFYSTITTGSGGDQVGNGAAVATVNTDYTQGSYETSSTSTNVALNGDGYYIVVDPDTGTKYYSRAGNFDFDKDGNLVDPYGNNVQGWVVNEGSASGSLTNVVLDQSQSPPNATSEVSLSMNLDSQSVDSAITSNPYTSEFNLYDGTEAPPLDDSRYSYSSTMTIYDENGSAHDLTTYMDPVSTDSDGNIIWEYVVSCDPEEDQRSFGGTDMNTTSGAGMLMTGTLVFNSEGQMTSMSSFTLTDTPVSSNAKDAANWELASFSDSGIPEMNVNFTGSTEGQEVAFSFGMSNPGADVGSNGGWSTGSTIKTLADITATTDYSDLPSFEDVELGTGATTSYSDTSSATYSAGQDGYPTGALLSVTVDENGIISGNYSNSQSIELYQLGLADFNNKNGLKANGSNLFSATTESGEAIIGTAGTAGFGSVVSNALEASNVDLASEMTKLIIIQASYQANSKVVTTANSMIETALSLKR